MAQAKKNGWTVINLKDIEKPSSRPKSDEPDFNTSKWESRKWKATSSLFPLFALLAQV